MWNALSLWSGTKQMMSSVMTLVILYACYAIYTYTHSKCIGHDYVVSKKSQALITNKLLQEADL